MPIEDTEICTAALSAAFDNVRQGFLLLDEQWRVTNFNSRLNEILRFPSSFPLKGATAFELVCKGAELGHYPGRSIEEAYAEWRKRFTSGKAGHHLGRRGDGRTVKIAYAPFGEGNWIVTYEDVSARVNAEEALARQNERLDAALSNMPHGVCMFDAEKTLVLCNDGYSGLYGLPPELTIPGTPLSRILNFRLSAGSAPIDMTAYFDVANAAEAAGDAKNGRVILRDGRTIRIAYNPMSGGGYVATHEDITEAVRAEEELRFRGLHDQLTGLPNIGLLRDRLGEALHRLRSGKMLAIHYVDLDNFKSVNDKHGHAIGDLLLKQVAERLQLCLDDADTLARIGGDEFVVLQTGMDAPEAAGGLARRMARAMVEPFNLEGRQVRLGLSIGISVCPQDSGDIDSLLKSAGLALFRSKSEGRSTYRFFELAMDERLQDRRLLETDLRQAVLSHAVLSEEFELYYQPQVDAQTETISGYEALLRWHRPLRGMVSPDKFISVAEEIGLIVPLGAWVIQQACRDAATWPEHLSVAVNLSSLQFKDMTLMRTVIAALESSGLSPLRLELEITESVLLADSERTIATLNQLHDLGVRVALDDFGTGYSSLSYLRSFSFDKIKIDRSFVRDLGKARDCSAIVRAIARLGADLGMTITAEGVETIEQLRLVRECGCTQVQGYFFGRPSPVDALRDQFRMDMAPARKLLETSTGGYARG